MEEVIEALQVEMMRKYHQVAMKNIGYAANAGISHTLCDETGRAIYLLHLVDVMDLVKNPVEKQFAIFIVPQGR